MENISSKINKYISLADLIVLFFCFGCVKSSIIKETPVADKHPEIIQETIDDGEKAKEEERQTISGKDIENKVNAVGDKEDKIQIKRAKISEIGQHAASLGFHRLTDPLQLKIASSSLEMIQNNDFGYDDCSRAFLLVKRAQFLHNLGRNDEARKILLKNWREILLPDEDLKTKGKFNSAPSAEAYYLQGNIALELASDAEDKKAAQLYGKQAVKSYYAVLNLYNPKECRFTPYAVKGFQAGRDFLVKRFKIKVAFPPEF